MEITSVLAIYFLFWVMSALLMLPIGVKTADEAGVEKVRGQADSAPVNFRPWQVVGRATVLASVLCGLYMANYFQGWVTVEDINIFGTPPGYQPEA